MHSSGVPTSRKIGETWGIPFAAFGMMGLTGSAQGLAAEVSGDGAAGSRADGQRRIHGAAAGRVRPKGNPTGFCEGDGVGGHIVRDVQLRCNRDIRIAVDGLVRH